MSNGFLCDPLRLSALAVKHLHANIEALSYFMMLALLACDCVEEFEYNFTAETRWR